MSFTLWVVFGTTGEDADKQEWLVRGFSSEKSAHDFAAVANDWLHERGVHSGPILARRIASDYDSRAILSVELRQTLPKPEWDPDLMVAYTGSNYFVRGPFLYQQDVDAYNKCAYCEVPFSKARSCHPVDRSVVESVLPQLNGEHVERMRRALSKNPEYTLCTYCFVRTTRSREEAEVLDK